MRTDAGGGGAAQPAAQALWSLLQWLRAAEAGTLHFAVVLLYRGPSTPAHMPVHWKRVQTQTDWGRAAACRTKSGGSCLQVGPCEPLAMLLAQEEGARGQGAESEAGSAASSTTAPLSLSAQRSACSAPLWPTSPHTLPPHPLASKAINKGFTSRIQQRSK